MARLGLPGGYHRTGRDELPTRPREPGPGLRPKAAGEEARRGLLQGDPPRLVSAAESCRGPRLSIDDLIQEGGIDPTMAVDKFEPDKGERLRIPATWWIGQPVGRKPISKEDD